MPSVRPLVTDNELDEQLRCLNPPIPADLVTRIIGAAEELQMRPRRWTLRRSIPLAAGIAIALVALGVVFAPRGGQVSAEVILERMEAALDGKCMYVETTQTVAATGPSDIDVWFQVTHEAGLLDYQVRTEDASDGTVRAWSGGVLRCYSRRYDTLVVSHRRPPDWGAAATILSRMSRVLSRDTTPHPGRPHVVGADVVDGHRCYLIDWSLSYGTILPGSPTAIREVWWVDRETHLPVAACRYASGPEVTGPTSYDFEQQPADPEEARKALRSPNTHVLRFSLVKAPVPGFFELADLTPRVTRDVRPQQESLLASRVTATGDKQVKVVVHDVLTSADGVAYAVVSARGTDPKRPRRSWFQMPQGSIPFSTYNRRWSRRGDPLDSKTMSVCVPVTSRGGVEYYVRPYSMFGMDDADVYLLILTPVRPGEPTRKGDELRFRLTVHGCDLDAQSDTIMASSEVPIAIPLPYPTLKGYALPSWLAAWVDKLRAEPGEGLFWVGGAFRESAWHLRDQALFEDALRMLQEADHWFAKAKEAGFPYPSELVGVPASEYMNLYADLGSVGEARRYAALSRQEALNWPQRDESDERARQEMLGEIDRCLRYLDAL